MKVPQLYSRRQLNQLTKKTSTDARADHSTNILLPVPTLSCDLELNHSSRCQKSFVRKLLSGYPDTVTEADT